MYEQRSVKSTISYKLRKQALERLIMKLQLSMSMHLFTDYFFIKAFLTKMELVKQLFVLEVEQGTDVSIPDDLCQSDLPWSFRYYDPILSFID